MYSVTFYCPEDQSEFTISHEKWEAVTIEAYQFISHVASCNLSAIGNDYMGCPTQYNLLALADTVRAILRYGIYVGTHHADNICYDVKGLKHTIFKAYLQFSRALTDLERSEQAKVVSKVKHVVDDVNTLIDQYFSHL
jgi:hypothetical protein